MSIFMMKSIVIMIIILSLLLVGCSASQNTTLDPTQVPTIAPPPSPSTTPQESNVTTTEENPYETRLIEVMGQEYFTGKAYRQEEDMEIDGESAVVFAVGENSPEKFTILDRFAVTSTGWVYEYDIVADSWEPITEIIKEEKPFQSAFIGYEDDVQETFGEGIPPFGIFLTPEEEESLEYFATEDGYHLFLVKATYGNPIKVYSLSLGDEGNLIRGDLLYETTGEILYLNCNFADLYPQVELITTDKDGNEYSYSPFISLKDGSNYLGEEAMELMPII